MCAMSLSGGVPCLHRVLGRVRMIVDRYSGETIGIDHVNRNHKVEMRQKRRKSKMKAKHACIECASWNEYERVTFDSEKKAEEMHMFLICTIKHQNYILLKTKELQNGVI